MDPFKTLREEAWEANQELNRSGLVLHTFGNASAFDKQRGAFAIKPSGVPYASLRWTDIVIVDLDGTGVDGTLRPSSDTRTHAVLYRRFEGLSGVAHTHSTHAVAWAQALRSIPVYGTTHADYLAFPVPCTPPMDDARIKGDYELETGNEIVAHFEAHDLAPGDIQMVLVGGHGPFTWGGSAAEAVHHSVILEEIARMAWLTESLNPDAQPLSPALIRKHHERKHGGEAYYGQR